LGAATYLSRGLCWGLVAGAAVGGVGGRLAMLVLRLTSADSVRGVKSDDGFVIGRFSTETFFLVVIAAMLGAIGGLVYLLVREWVPSHWRAVAFGALCATVMGSVIISPDGTDFTELSPLSLAVAMFVLIPAAYGVVASMLVERSLRRQRPRHGVWRWLAILPLGLLLFSGAFALILVVVFAIVLLANRSGRLAELWRSAGVTWVGRAALSIVFLASGSALLQDAAEIL
jgi:hypothetical protein